MDTYCINCGKTFDDPRPNAIRGLIAGGISDVEIIRNAVSTEPFCPACTEEAARLNKIVHSMLRAASDQADKEFKIFGQKRRECRSREDP